MISLQHRIEAASLWRRGIAVLIDAAITLVAAIFVAGAVGPRAVMQQGDGFLVRWVILGGAYATSSIGRDGRSLGKLLMGLQVWTFGLYIGGLIDAAAALFDARRRTIHDRWVRSVVVRAAL